MSTDRRAFLEAAGWALPALMTANLPSYRMPQADGAPYVLAIIEAGVCLDPDTKRDVDTCVSYLRSLGMRVLRIHERANEVAQVLVRKDCATREQALEIIERAMRARNFLYRLQGRALPDIGGRVVAMETHLE